MRISDWSSDVCSSDLAPALHDLEEEALAEIGAVELEVLARLVAVVEDVLRAQPRRELGGEVETGLQVVVVVVRDLERPEAQPLQRRGGGEDVTTGKGNVLDARPEAFGDEMACESLRSEEHTSELQSLMRNS